MCLDIALPAICGKPTVAVTYHVIVTVRESNNPSVHANAAYTITIFQQQKGRVVDDRRLITDQLAV